MRSGTPGYWPWPVAVPTIMKVIGVLTAIVIAILAIAVLFFVAGANPLNAIVQTINDLGRFLADPFRFIFRIEGEPKGTFALNYAIAAAVYLVIGVLLSKLVVAVGGLVARRRTGARPAPRRDA